MRASLTMLIVAAIGLVAGAALIGTWAVGLAVMADSATLAGFALLRDIPARPEPQAQTLPDILERARRAQ